MERVSDDHAEALHLLAHLREQMAAHPDLTLEEYRALLAARVWRTSGRSLPDPLGDDYEYPSEDELVGQPPEWYFKHVGRLATRAVLLEFHMAYVVIQLQDTSATVSERAVRALVADHDHTLVKRVRAAKDKDRRVAPLVERWLSLRLERDKFVHALLWWFDWDDDTLPDGWEAHHERTGTRLAMTEATRNMVRRTIEGTDALIRDVVELSMNLDVEAGRPLRRSSFKLDDDPVKRATWTT